MKRSVLFFYCCLIGFALSAQVSAPLYVGSRAAGMAGYNLSFDNADAIFGNVAGFGLSRQLAVAAAAERRYNLTELQQVTAGVVVPNGFGGLGLTINQTGSKDYREQRVGLGYGREFADGFAMGIRFNYLNLDLFEYGSRALFSVDLGSVYEFNEQLAFGVLAQVPFVSELPEGERLNSVLQFGLHWRPAKQALLVAALEKDFENFRFRTGFEYLITETIYVRAGVVTDPVEYSLGLGWAFVEHFRLDLSAQRHIFLGWTPGITMIWTQPEESSDR